jgi:hypothetical protein
MTKYIMGILIFLSGCATTGTNGVIQIGSNLYMIGGLGKFTDFSGSAVKARMFQEGAKFCENKGLIMVPTYGFGADSGFGAYASAEVQFRCMSK